MTETPPLAPVSSRPPGRPRDPEVDRAILEATIERPSSDCSSRLRMISAKPKTPMATTTKPMPSDSSGTLNAIRDCPVSMSEPTIDISR